MNQSFLNNFKGNLIYDKKLLLLGEISGLLFCIDYEKIIGCVYKKSFLQYGYFLLEDILSKNKNSFVINEAKNKKEFYEIIGKAVKNENEKLIGTIDDIEFDLTFKLKYIFIDSGYMFFMNKKNISQKNIIKMSKKAILSYNKDDIIVKDKQIIKENKKILENITKIFINIPTPNYNINPLINYEYE